MEDYKTKYEVAMKNAERVYKNSDEHGKRIIESIFPQFRESENERIRKMLIARVRTAEELNEELREWIIAYLERQKERQPMEIHIDNPNIQKFDSDVKVTTSDSSADGKELLYVSNKSYDIGFRDGVASVKPAEWSEEDETCLEYALWCVMKTRHFVAKDACDLDACRCAENWLKSLRLQSHWKPSKEQMRVFFKANPVNLMPEELATYHSLYNDFQKHYGL